MPRERVVGAARLAELMCGPAAELEARRQERIWARVPSSARQYWSDIQYMEHVHQLAPADQRAWATPLEDVFIVRLADGLMQAEASAAVVGRMRCAWRIWKELCASEIDESLYEEGNRQLEGYRRQCRASRIPRGAVTWGKLQQVMSAAGERGHDPRGYLLSWLAKLRPAQVGTLRVRDVHLGPQGASIVLYAATKKRGREGDQVLVDGQPRNVPFGRELLEALVAGRTDEELLFPGWDANAASATVRDCAVALEWDSSVRWDGVHSLRHGGQLASRLLDDEAELREMAGGGWSSLAMARWYGRVRGADGER